MVPEVKIGAKTGCKELGVVDVSRSKMPISFVPFTSASHVLSMKQLQRWAPSVEPNRYSKMLVKESQYKVEVAKSLVDEAHTFLLLNFLSARLRK